MGTQLRKHDRNRADQLIGPDDVIGVDEQCDQHGAWRDLRPTTAEEAESA
ncbi:hypothetical protein [Amycolatopsis sp. DG1A-15b]|nr:hypothetical protein [Amycolatopsis sp. DG1A-15b]WIX90324.1 hypothetical protein QRY02_07785 [Amycolatopsis sp. DG1A-15b]